MFLRKDKVMLKFLFVLAVSLYGSMVKADFNPVDSIVKVIIPFSPGGSVDTAFKHLQNYAAEKKIILVPVYKPGAEGLIGTQALVESPGDGLHLSLTLSSVVGLYQFRNANANLTVLTGIQNNIMVMVANPQRFSKSLSDLDDIVKTSNSLNFGYGSPSHRVVFNQYFDFVKAKPQQSLIRYNGGSRVITDLLGGHIDIGILPLTLVKPNIDAGTLKLIAIAVKTDYAEFRDVPRLGEIYPGWKNFDGVLAIAPDTLKASAREFWNKFFQDYLEDPRVKKEFSAASTPAMPFGPQYILESIRNNYNSFRNSDSK